MNTHQPDPEPPGGKVATASMALGDKLAEWLIHRAARSAPADLVDRLQEEWLADLGGCPSTASRLRFAVGCCWAVRIIAIEYAAGAATAATPSGEKLAVARPGGDPDFFPRNALTVIAVVAFHIAVFYALLVGMGVDVTRIVPTSFQTTIIPDPQPAPPSPLLPRPTVTGFVLPVPPPELPTTSVTEDTVDVVPEAAGGHPTSPTSTAPSHEVSIVTGGPGAGFPATDDFYPSAAKRAEEQGVATVRVCVDPAGRLTAIPSLVQGSGYSRLDDGALQLAKAGSGHYRASVEDGHAVNGCYAFRVRFQLRQ